jgi:hypothetical protein
MIYRIRYAVATLEKDALNKPLRRAGHIEVKADDRKSAIIEAKRIIATRYDLPADEKKWPDPESENKIHQNRFSIEECGLCQKLEDKSKKK